MRFLPSDVTKSTTARRLLGDNQLESYVAKQRRANAERKASFSSDRMRRRRPDQIPASSPGAKPGDVEKSAAGLAVERHAIGEPALPALATIVHQRLCYGQREGDIAAFNALGANDAARISAWVTEQLADDPADPAPGKEAAWGFTTLGKSAFDLWHDHHRNPDWQVFIRPVNEVERRTIVRATHSTRQLQEVVFEFWHNHFSIFAEDEGPMMVVFDREVIRTHGLGNFRTLLGASVKSWAMLDYLDNKYNSYAPWAENDGINENFARELLELHTLGDENYFPGMTPDQVPDGPDGLKVGYTDTDVSAAARCLTGWTTEDAYIYMPGVWPPIDFEFSFYDEWHDNENVKTVLGQAIDNLSDADGGTVQDGEELLDVLAGHRGTAEFICRKLCRRLIQDDPSEVLVQSAADIFQSNSTASDQIAKVVRHIVESADFASTFGEKIKRPYEIIVSQMRALDFDFPLTQGDDFQSDRAGWFMWQFYLTGQLPFGWGPPNGYPDVRAAWSGSSPRVMTWWFSNFLCNVTTDAAGGETRYIDIAALTGDLTTMTPTQIVDHWINRLCGRSIPAGERAEFITFMADGANANAPLDAFRLAEDYRAPAQIRTLVALMAMSPSFLWR